MTDTNTDAPTKPTFGELLDKIEAIQTAKAERRAAEIEAGKKPRPFEQEETDRDELFGTALIEGGRLIVRLVSALEAIAEGVKAAQK